MAWACRFRAGEADTNRSLKLTVKVASYIFSFFRAVRDPVQNQKHIEKPNKPTSPHPRPPNPQNQTKAWMMSKECQPKLSSGYHNHTCACVLTHTCVTSYIWSHTHTHSTHTLTFSNRNHNNSVTQSKTQRHVQNLPWLWEETVFSALSGHVGNKYYGKEFPRCAMQWEGLMLCGS